MIVDGIDLAFGRLSKSNGDHARFVCRETAAAYRLIVNGVPGPFGAGFTNYVVCKTRWGWQIRRYETEMLLDYGACYSTRAAAAEAAIAIDEPRGASIRKLQIRADEAVAS